LIWTNWSGVVPENELSVVTRMAHQGARMIYAFIRAELTRRAGVPDDQMDTS
jgi:hypothetical protein